MSAPGGHEGTGAGGRDGTGGRDGGGLDERALVGAFLRGDPGMSRNRNFELYASDLGRRARRRASFLRSVARDFERARCDQGSVTVDRGPFARGRVRVVIHHPEFTRHAYLASDEVDLVTQLSRLAARVFDP